MFTIAKDAAKTGTETVTETVTKTAEQRHRALSLQYDCSMKEDDDDDVSAGSDAVSDDAFEAAASDFNKFDGFPFATQTQSSIRSKKFRITLRAKKRKSRKDCKGS